MKKKRKVTSEKKTQRRLCCCSFMRNAVRCPLLIVRLRYRAMAACARRTEDPQRREESGRRRWIKKDPCSPPFDRSRPSLLPTLRQSKSATTARPTAAPLRPLSRPPPRWTRSPSTIDRYQLYIEACHSVSAYVSKFSLYQRITNTCRIPKAKSDQLPFPFPSLLPLSSIFPAPPLLLPLRASSPCNTLCGSVAGSDGRPLPQCAAAVALRAGGSHLARPLSLCGAGRSPVRPPPPRQELERVSGWPAKQAGTAMCVCVCVRVCEGGRGRWGWG